MEMLCIGQAQSTHSERVPRFLQTNGLIPYFSTQRNTTYLEMPFKVFASHVHMVRANLTPVLHSQPMELVQPIGDGFSIPSKRQFKGIVNLLLLWLLCYFTSCTVSGRSRRSRGYILHELSFTFACCEREPTFDVRFSLCQDGLQWNKEGSYKVG